jgi:hypothetical protein
MVTRTRTLRGLEEKTMRWVQARRRYALSRVRRTSSDVCYGRQMNTRRASRRVMHVIMYHCKLSRETNAEKTAREWMGEVESEAAGPGTIGTLVSFFSFATAIRCSFDLFWLINRNLVRHSCCPLWSFQLFSHSRKPLSHLLSDALPHSVFSLGVSPTFYFTSHPSGKTCDDISLVSILQLLHHCFTFTWFFL